MKYIINGKKYNCTFSEAKDVALFDQSVKEIFFADGRPTFWRYDGIRWYLAETILYG